MTGNCWRDVSTYLPQISPQNNITAGRMEAARSRTELTVAAVIIEIQIAKFDYNPRRPTNELAPSR
jgi:hypothetical protein